MTLKKMLAIRVLNSLELLEVSPIVPMDILLPTLVHHAISILYLPITMNQLTAYSINTLAFISVTISAIRLDHIYM